MRANAGDAAVIRRYYEKRLTPFCPTPKARRDVLSLLDQRKALHYAGEALLAAALPFSGDPALREAIDSFRGVLEGRAKA